jgi:hypothetical protein
LFLFGLPVVLFGRGLPDVAQRAAEAIVGLTIVGLAVRLLMRWQRGYFHSHRHQHGALSHVHPHVHEDRQKAPHPTRHGHAHAESLGRSPLAAFSIGLVHGAGGSAAVGVLLVAAVAGRASAVVGLLLFAAATAASMAVVSGLVGYGLVRGIVAPKMERLVPAFAALSLAFGVWYAVSALG